MGYRDEEDRSSRAQRLLSRIRIASPCPASWDAMAGNERTRLCGLCDKQVHDLSSLTALEGLRLITEAEGSACVRLFRRPDGKVQTADCNAGTQRRKRRLRVLAAGAALSGAAALAVAAWPEHPVSSPVARAEPPEEVFDEDTFLHGHPPAPLAHPAELRGQIVVSPADRGPFREFLETCHHQDCMSTDLLTDE